MNIDDINIYNTFTKFFLFKLFYALTFIIFMNFLLFFNNSKNNFNYEIKLYKKYIKICNRVKKYDNMEKTKNANPYLSIILPVYNMEKYIERALLSILYQSFQDFEIILINDFSNDNTKQIIQKYWKKEKKIRMIEHKENLGTQE